MTEGSRKPEPTATFQLTRLGQTIGIRGEDGGGMATGLFQDISGGHADELVLRWNNYALFRKLLEAVADSTHEEAWCHSDGKDLRTCWHVPSELIADIESALRAATNA